MNDIYYMQKALDLAKKGGRKAAPNPMVGAVIVCNNEIIGSGYHKQSGTAHAEVNAVDSVKDKTLLSKSTIYVTLEPCAHYGKTPPCADLIIKHKFKRCVIACIDTFSEVSGKGIERLKAAGIEVETCVLEKEARAINKRFFTYHEKKRPFVILKWAETKDGFIDRLPENRNKGVNWITQPETKKTVHKWRAEEQAILVGVITIINDDAALDVREIKGRNPHRFIIDPNFRTPLTSKVLTDGNPTTLFVKEGKYTPLKNVAFITLKDFSIQTILNAIYKKNILSVFVEGGATTLNHFIVSNLWDEARVFTGKPTFNRGLLAPKLELPASNSEMINTDKLNYYFNN